MYTTIFHFIAGIYILVTSANVQTKSPPNLSSKTSSYPGPASATSSVYGVFEGRTPCQEIARELNLKVRTECTKRKVGLTLYQDSITLKPTTYKIVGMGEKTGEGKWHIVKGTATDSKAIVYQLNMGDRFLFIYKGDDNVLFLLDKNKNFLIGNDDHSYTLNRVRNSKSWDNWRYLANRGESFLVSPYILWALIIHDLFHCFFYLF